MALTNEVESDERSYPDPRKRRTASVREKDHVSSASLPQKRITIWHFAKKIKKTKISVIRALTFGQKVHTE